MDNGFIDIYHRYFSDYEPIDAFLFHAEEELTGISLAGKKVLEIGCGRGAFSLYMALSAKAEKVIALDEAEGHGAHATYLRHLEEIVSKHSVANVETMKASISKTPIKNRMDFLCHDITKRLEFADKSFDLIVCKGTLDAVLCNQNAHEKVEAMMTECQRVLDAHGAMVVISYGAPDDRMDCFDNTLWKEIKSYTAPKPYVPGMTDIR